MSLFCLNQYRPRRIITTLARLAAGSVVRVETDLFQSPKWSAQRTLQLALLVAVCVLTGCDQIDQVGFVDSHEGLEPGEYSSFNQFCQEVVPILESRCAVNCHGVSPEKFEEFSHSPDHAGFFYFPINPATGKISGHEALLASWKTARGANESHDGDHGASAVSRIDYQELPKFSPLIRVPLADQLGGLPHRGLDVFFSVDDPDYLTMQRWIEAEIALRPVEPKSLKPHEEFFRDRVLPIMVNNNCFIASCHGPAVFNDLKLKLPMPSMEGRFDPKRDFSTREIAANRKLTLGAKSRFANLGGDLKLSRLLTKNLPISKGGVHQRGGNNQFFDSYDDPDVKVILEWLTMEQAALVNKLTAGAKPVSKEDVGRLQGMVFIRGPKHQPRRYFEFDTFWPGSDLFVLPCDKEGNLSSAEPVNLTAAFHPSGPAEIQAVDVRYDARMVVFSMRLNAESGFRIYELELDENLNGIKESFRQVTSGPDRLDNGTLIHHVDPLYAPGPDDPTDTALDNVVICFASNAAGHYASSVQFGLLGETDAGTKKELVDAQRTEKPGTFDGRRIYIVDGPNRGQWRTIVSHEQDTESVVGAKLILDAPLPNPIDRRTVYEIEQKEAVNISSYDIWRIVPSTGKGADAGKPHRMTFTSAQERRPTMRTTGEVMFTSVRNIGYQANRPVFNGAIFRVMAGGFDYHIQGNNRSRFSIVSDSREVPQGLETRMALDPRNYWSGGLMLLVDHGFGINIEPENPVDNIPLAEGGDILGQPLQPSSVRYLHGQRPFFPEIGADAVTMTGVSPGGSYRDPYPLPDGTLLISHVSDSLNHLDEKADPDWNLYRLRFTGALQSEDAQKVGPVKLELIKGVSTKEMAEYSPRPVIIRLKEKSKTHQKFAATYSETKPKRIEGVLRMPPETPGEIECYDYPLLQSFLTNFAPVGEKDFRSEMPGLPGSTTDSQHVFRFVRIVAQVPPEKSELSPLGLKDGNTDPFATPTSLGIHTRRLIVSEIPLELDGTFYAEVPTGVPLIVQGLNEDRMAMHSMNRWFYVQPGEKLTFSIPRRIFPNLCAGCHGTLTGDNTDALGPPDIVSAASRVMATWDPVTGRRRKPFGHGKKTEDYVSVDFRQDVQPILDRHCVSCHDGSSVHSAGLDLRGQATRHYTISYESLHRLSDPKSGQHAAKYFVDEREALSSKSYLIEKLTGKEFDAPQTITNVGTPHPVDSSLSKEELLTLIRWIDLGATFTGGHTPEKTGDPPRTDLTGLQ